METKFERNIHRYIIEECAKVERKKMASYTMFRMAKFESNCQISERKFSKIKCELYNLYFFMLYNHIIKKKETHNKPRETWNSKRIQNFIKVTLAELWLS